MQARLELSCGPLYHTRDGGDLRTQLLDREWPAELAEALKKLPGLVWKANIVWYDVSKKLHLYGYQFSYIPSMIHQNILIFRKETA